MRCAERTEPFVGYYELEVCGGRVKLPRAFLGGWLKRAEYVVFEQHGVRVMQLGEAGMAADMASALMEERISAKSGAAQIDRHGRLEIPQSLAIWAGMTVAVVGMNRHIEIREIGANRAMTEKGGAFFSAEGDVCPKRNAEFREGAL